MSSFSTECSADPVCVETKRESAQALLDYERDVAKAVEIEELRAFLVACAASNRSLVVDGSYLSRTSMTRFFSRKNTREDYLYIPKGLKKRDLACMDGAQVKAFLYGGSY